LSIYQARNCGYTGGMVLSMVAVCRGDTLVAAHAPDGVLNDNATP
jgi:hypothetical protein